MNTEQNKENWKQRMPKTNEQLELAEYLLSWNLELQYVFLFKKNEKWHLLK
jgi:hypothetical protein